MPTLSPVGKIVAVIVAVVVVFTTSIMWWTSKPKSTTSLTVSTPSVPPVAEPTPQDSPSAAVARADDADAAKPPAPELSEETRRLARLTIEEEEATRHIKAQTARLRAQRELCAELACQKQVVAKQEYRVRRINVPVQSHGCGDLNEGLRNICMIAQNR